MRAGTVSPGLRLDRRASGRVNSATTASSASGRSAKGAASGPRDRVAGAALGLAPEQRGKAGGTQRQQDRPAALAGFGHFKGEGAALLERGELLEAHDIGRPAPRPAAQRTAPARRRRPRRAASPPARATRSAVSGSSTGSASSTSPSPPNTGRSAKAGRAAESRRAPARPSRRNPARCLRPAHRSARPVRRQQARRQASRWRSAARRR